MSCATAVASIPLRCIPATAFPSAPANVRFAHSVKVGQFDRVAFKQSAEELFDNLFSYDRELKETFKYANAMVHGDCEQKQELKGYVNAEHHLKEQPGHYHELTDLPAVSLANDIDDEAVYGKYRQRKSGTRSNSR